MQFPERKGWHSDQSFRRPPPDGSLLYCARPALPNQGRTLFCDASAAYEALLPSEVAEVEQMEIIHCITSAGRSEASVRSGNTRNSRSDEGARYLQPVRQPAVRVHPVTGRRSLYLVMGQADWLDGPVVGMEKGPDGAGADVPAQADVARNPAAVRLLPRVECGRLRAVRQPLSTTRGHMVQRERREKGVVAGDSDRESGL